MLKYRLKLSQGQVWVHDCDTILHNVKGELTSLVLYLMQAGNALDIVQGSFLIFTISPNIPWDKGREVGDAVEPVSFGVGRHGRLYQDIDGGEEGALAKALKMINEIFFPF